MRGQNFPKFISRHALVKLGPWVPDNWVYWLLNDIAAFSSERIISRTFGRHLRGDALSMVLNKNRSELAHWHAPEHEHISCVCGTACKRFVLHVQLSHRNAGGVSLTRAWREPSHTALCVKSQYLNCEAKLSQEQPNLADVSQFFGPGNAGNP